MTRNINKVLLVILASGFLAGCNSDETSSSTLSALSIEVGKSIVAEDSILDKNLKILVEKGYLTEEQRIIGLASANAMLNSPETSASLTSEIAKVTDVTKCVLANADKFATILPSKAELDSKISDQIETTLNQSQIPSAGETYSPEQAQILTDTFVASLKEKLGCS